MARLDSGYTQVSFNLVSVQVCMILSCVCVPCKSIIKMGEGGIPLNFHSNHIELLMPFGILLPAPVVVPICLCTKEAIHSYNI